MTVGAADAGVEKDAGWRISPPVPVYRPFEAAPETTLLVRSR